MVPPRADLKEFLMRTPFFGGLADDSLDLLLAMLVERRLAAGATVFREGDQGKSMYIVESGELVAFKRGESGLQVRMTRFGRGDFFGDTTLIEMQPRPATVVAESDAVLHELNTADLYRLYREDTKAYILVLQNMNRELCRRLRRAENRVTQFADETGDERTQIRVQPLPASRR